MKVQDNGCKQSSESTFNPVFNQIIDSFLIELAKYDQINKKTNDTIKMIAYIRIEQSSRNNSFKIHLEGILSDSLLKTTTINQAFNRNNRYICLDYNISNLINQNTSYLMDSLIKTSKILSYTKPIRDVPSWLFLVEKDRITKVNKNAQSCFLEVKNYISKQEFNQLKFYPVDEWGDVYNEQGIKIDSLRENKN